MLNISRDIQSLSNFKRNTLDLIEQMKQTGQPIILTINGKAELVVQDAAAYQKMLEMIERLEAILATKQSLEDIKAGRTQSLSDFEKTMQEKYGIGEA
jgi:prevent-host-death family protein